MAEITFFDEKEILLRKTHQSLPSGENRGTSHAYTQFRMGPELLLQPRTYTTDQPLELAAACLPELRQAVDIIHSEHFHKLSELKPECQMLLYAVLNCYINWVDHNHKQILLVPGQPSQQQPNDEGDMRCSRCLKNQTFHSSEVRGNPKNIDVEFDFEQLKFVSSCCAATMINVPLSTRDVNTCTFTDLKQMYTSCMKCSQPIFSEVLVDVKGYTIHYNTIYGLSSPAVSRAQHFL